MSETEKMVTTAPTSKATKVKPYNLFDNCGTKSPTAAKTKSGKCAKSSKSPTAKPTAQTTPGGDFGVVETTTLTLVDTVEQEPVRQQIIFNYYFLSALYFFITCLSHRMPMFISTDTRYITIYGGWTRNFCARKCT